MTIIVTIIIIIFGVIITFSIFKKEERYKIDYPEVLGYSICIVAIFVISGYWKISTIEYKDLKASFTAVAEKIESSQKKIEDVNKSIDDKIEIEENLKRKKILQSFVGENSKKYEYSKRELVDKIYDMYRILEEGVKEKNELKVSKFFSDEYNRVEGNKIYNKKEEIKRWSKYFGRNLGFLLMNLKEVNEGRVKVTGEAMFLGEGESSRWSFTDTMVLRKKTMVWQCIK